MGMREPTCTVVIPSRNCINYLPTALDSVAAQGCEDVEVIVVDDGSTDGTSDWVNRQARRGVHLRVIATEGIGPSGARNAAIAEASSDLIAFLDADDVWWPGKLKPQIAYHRENADIGFTFTDYIHVGPDSRTYGTCFEYAQCSWTRTTTADYTRLDVAEARLLADNVVGTSTVVATRRALEAVGGFPSVQFSAEDWDLWLRIASSTSVAFTNAVTMSYLMRPGSVTSNRQRRIAAMDNIVDRYVRCTEPTTRRAVKRAKAHIEVARAEAAREQGQFAGAAMSHLRALPALSNRRTARAAASDIVATGKGLLRKALTVT